jgi:hypothetical protein
LKEDHCKRGYIYGEEAVAEKASGLEEGHLRAEEIGVDEDNERADPHDDENRCDDGFAVALAPNGESGAQQEAEN